jgi:small subunit ribosomal protein S17
MTPDKTKGKIFVGEVVSDKMKGTITVKLSYQRRHPLYKKIIKRYKKIYAENNLSARIGDTVRLREIRPLSKLKRFTTVAIVKKFSSTL